ncbi:MULTISPECIES: hypothetical protein [unclassified Bradyrhizobium]|uniref:hypothetical protein n=1 Tax=unclassified Bradyrhizobium TaxID=2631580 RepID=UPI0028E607B5|nr:MULTISPECIES: hypothetical protein [unclassified Bradyrhizobium]
MSNGLVSSAQHAAIELDPALGRHHLADLLPDHVQDARMQGVGRIGFNVDGIAQRALRTVEELDGRVVES